MMSERSTDVADVAYEMRLCALGWQPEARIVGNVRTEDMVRVCDAFAAARARVEELEAEVALQTKLKMAAREQAELEAERAVKAESAAALLTEQKECDLKIMKDAQSLVAELTAENKQRAYEVDELRAGPGGQYLAALERDEPLAWLNEQAQAAQHDAAATFAALSQERDHASSAGRREAMEEAVRACEALAAELTSRAKAAPAHSPSERNAMAGAVACRRAAGRIRALADRGAMESGRLR
jgi:hypothetical protein